MKESKEQKIKRLLKSGNHSYKKIDAALIKGVSRVTIDNNLIFFNLEDGRIINDEAFNNWQPKRKNEN